MCVQVYVRVSLMPFIISLERQQEKGFKLQMHDFEQMCQSMSITHLKHLPSFKTFVPRT